MKFFCSKKVLSLVLLFTLVISNYLQPSLTSAEKEMGSNPENISRMTLDSSSNKTLNLTDEYVTDRFIVKYKNDQGRLDISKALNGKTKSSKKIKTQKNKNFDLITTTTKMKPADFFSNIKNKKADANIEYIEPDHELIAASNDPEMERQWGLYNKESLDNGFKVDADVTSAWTQSQGEGSVIAVIDTGIDITHEDLADNIWTNTSEIPDNGIDDDGDGYIDDVNGWNFSDDNNLMHSKELSDDEVHGTHIAGIIAAQIDNMKGISGIAPKSKILPLKVFKNGIAFTSDIIEAIEYAQSKGIRIVNCSWEMISATGESLSLKEAIDTSNMLFVFAAGNDSQNIDIKPIYPSTYESENIISVASLNKSGGLSSFSNYGANSVDVAAPGENIISTIPNNKYDSLSGTSAAAAFVSGEAALVLSQEPSLSPEELKLRLIDTPDKISSLQGLVYKGNKINCYNAVENIKNDIVINTGNNYLNSKAPQPSNFLGQTPTPGVSVNENSSSYSLEGETSSSAYYGFNGHTYAIYNDSLTWHEAESYCESLGGHLVTITSNQEDNFVFGLLHYGTKSSYWMGATDEVTEGTWKWVTGEPFSYTHWSYGSPDNYLGNEDYLSMINIQHNYLPSQWNDASGINADPYYQLQNFGFICEWDYLDPRAQIDRDGNTMDTATSISIDEEIPGSIDYPGDLDCFRFIAPKGGTYRIESIGTTDTYGYLYDSSGRLLGYNDDGAGNAQFLINSNLQENKSYYVFVRHYSSSRTGSYRIKITPQLLLNIDSLTYTASPLKIDDQENLRVNLSYPVSKIPGNFYIEAKCSRDNTNWYVKGSKNLSISTGNTSSSLDIPIVFSDPGEVYTKIVVYDNPGGNILAEKAKTTTDMVGGGALPDLIITDVTMSPLDPIMNDQVTFLATIQNIDDGASPNGVIHGVSFYVDGTEVAWSTNYTSSIGPGEVVTVIASGGPNGNKIWNAIPGTHTITADVDATSKRIPESNENNNYYTPGKTFYVATSKFSGSGLLGTGDNSTDQSKMVGEPVNIISGNYYSDDVDLSMPDIGQRLEIKRYYNSLDVREGMLGKAWRLSYESSIREDKLGHIISVTYPDGKTKEFAPVEGSNEYSSPAGILDKLLKNSDGTYNLKIHSSKLTYTYNLNGLLSFVTDKNGNSITIQYNEEGQMTAILGANGKALQIANENGKIKTITDPSGRTIEYSYDTSGNLTQVKGVGDGIVKYEYENGYLKSITDENNIKFIENQYDQQGRVILQYDENRNQTKFTYDEQKGENTYTQVAIGSTRRYSYNEQFDITKITYDDGTYEEYTYDAHGNKTSVRDRNGNVTKFSYDQNGNMLSKTAPAPFNYVTNYVYDKNDNLVQMTTPGGSKVNFEYDSNSNMLKMTNKVDAVTSVSTSYAYDTCGRLTSLTDAQNSTTTFEYQENIGSPVKVTDAEGNVSQYSYDSLGRRTSIINSYGTTNIAYNNNDKIEKIIDPLGNITRMKYDVRGNLIKSIKPEQYNETADDGKGYTFVYDGADRLLRQIDPMGIVSAAKYDVNGNKTKVTNPNYYDENTDDGTGIGYEYDKDQRLIKTTNPSGKKSRIKYDAAGNKIKVINANNYNEATDDGPGVQCGYDQLNRLVEVKDADGNVIKKLLYDADGRVIKEIDAKGYLSGSDDLKRYGTIYRYNLAGWLLESRKPVKLENDIIYYQVTKYTYNNIGMVLEEKVSPNYVTVSGEPSNWRIIHYTYDKNAKINTISDNAGGLMEYTYDALGNTTSEKVKVNDDKYKVTGYEYDGLGRITKAWNEIDASDLSTGGSGKVNAETIFKYDKNGNITKVTSPEGYSTTFVYDDSGKLISKSEQVSADQIEVKSVSASITSPKRTMYAGQQYEYRVELNAGVLVTAASMEINYDARLFELVSNTPLVSGTTINSDTVGKVTLNVTGANFNGSNTLAGLTFRVKEGVTGTGYITINNESKYTDNEGTQYKFTELTGKTAVIKNADMNGDGMIDTDDFTEVSIMQGVDKNNTEYKETYDINGNGVIDVSDLDYLKDNLFADNIPETNKLNVAKFLEKTTNATYRASSSVVTRTTAYLYDKAGNIIKETDTNGNSINYTYDAYNNLISMADKSGAESRVFYDELGNRVKTVAPQNYDAATGNGPGTTYTYDTMGRLKEVKDALGNTVLKNEYDVNGLVIKKTDATGNSVEYSYDIGGRVTSVATPEAKRRGKVSGSYTYDALGSIISHTDGEDNTTLYERDVWGRATKVTDPNGIETLYEYDKMGNVVSTTDGNGNTTLYSYNSLNKLASTTDPSNQTMTYKYDKQGRLVQQVDRNGQTTMYQYNKDNNITESSIVGKNETEKFLYNKDGSLLAAINNSGVDQFEYTVSGQIEKRIRNGKAVLDYSYNKNGNVASVTDIKGATTGYTYDVLGRMKTVSDGSNDIATYNYNDDYTVSSINYSTGINVSYAYDLDKNLTSLINKNPEGGIIGSYSYTYDNNGNQTSKMENGVTTNYAYDKLNRLVSAGEETYAYDNSGNRIKKTNGTDVTEYSYDSRNRLTQNVNNGIISTYSYDNNGNLLSKVENGQTTSYAYDGYNRMIEVNNPDGTWMQNVYDATGLRAAAIENGLRFDFTFDKGSVIAELDASNNLVSRSIRGLGLIAQKDNSGTLSYYLQNGHGDIANIVNGNGEVLNSYSYDAFGNTMSYEETVLNRFRYADEQFDTITGQYYLRARFYEPELGRFTQEDTYRGDGLNLYVYVGSNPLKYVDPSGYNSKDIVTTELSQAEKFVNIMGDNGINYYGGNQAWYPREAQVFGGCGSVAAANISAYLAMTNPELGRLYSYNINNIKESDFIKHMNQIYDYVTPEEVPVMGGEKIPLVGEVPLSLGLDMYGLVSGVIDFAKSRGVNLSANIATNSSHIVSDGRKTWLSSADTLTLKDAVAMIKVGLQKDSPVALLNMFNPVDMKFTAPYNGKERSTTYQQHWVTITSLEENVKTGIYTVKVSTWGGHATLNLNDVWNNVDLSEKMFPTGIVYFEPTEDSSGDRGLLDIISKLPKPF